MKWTKEDDVRILPFIEEADRYDELHETIPWEEFMKELENEERREGIYKRSNIITLKLANWLGKISKRFVKI